METILIGAVVALLILASFFAGAAVGVKLGRKMAEPRPSSGSTEEPSEEERRRIMEDQRAFEDLLHYNTDIVYKLRTDLGGDMNES